MAVHLKIVNGTREGSKSLCLSCSHSLIRRGDKEEIITCTEEYYKPRDLRFYVLECNKYYPANIPSISNMYKTAWILETSKSNEIGFVPYKKWRAERPGEDYDIEKSPNNPFAQ